MYSRNELLKKASNSQEKLIISRVLDKVDICLKKHNMTFTDFLNPTETAFIYNNILKNIRDVNFLIFGGTDECERNIIGFSPEYMDICKNDFPIKAINIKRNIKFSSDLSHRDYLGSILGIGIDREKTGDIIIFDDCAMCFVLENVADYIAANLVKIGRTSVKTEVLNITEIDIPKANIIEKRATVSSMRLDSVIGAAFNISRGKSQDFIHSEKVNVNWIPINNVSHILKENDMISVRGKGRFRIGNEIGKTKKDRLGVIFLMYV